MIGFGERPRTEQPQRRTSANPEAFIGAHSKLYRAEVDNVKTLCIVGQ